MPLKLVQNKATQELEFQEIWGNPVPIIKSLDDFPFSRQTEISRLTQNLGRGLTGIEQYCMQIYCEATQLNPRIDDRYSYEKLQRILDKATPESRKDFAAQLLAWSAPFISSLFPDESLEEEKPEEGDTKKVKASRSSGGK